MIIVIVRRDVFQFLELDDCTSLELDDCFLLALLVFFRFYLVLSSWAFSLAFCYSISHAYSLAFP